ncbi:MAG: Free methionine-R-sulfoxide reductase [Sodalis sp.]|nr:MAG: Free methionine-R-sulfoxide reductase [Sodalis sp.]
MCMLSGPYCLRRCANNSAIIMPITIDERAVEVFDIDSTIYQRFDQNDEDGLKAVVNYLCRRLETTNLCKFITNI